METTSLAALVESQQIQNLAQLREGSGMKLYEIIEEARKIDPTFPPTHEGLINIEKRGTCDIWRLQALASVYNIPLEIIAKLAIPPARKNTPEK